MGNEHTDYTGEVDVPPEAIQIVDPEVVAKLTPGTRVTEITAHGASFWTRTARLDTLQCDGSPKTYFLKTSYRERGRMMMSGEYAAMCLIHKSVPDLVPLPISWGTYATIPDVHFFLCDFHEMTDELPDLTFFPAKMAELHREATSPDGRYGFHTTTFHGNTPLDHGWANTWEEYFTTRTKKLIQMEQEAQGPCDEILQLAVPFFDKVVPRLLRPLETGEHRIRPSLVHGDLWHGNASVDSNTERPVIFDAACFYAHNEYDLGVWRADWNKLGRAHMMQYHKHFPISQPEEDHDDRNLLYATRVNILDSILYKGYSGYREQLIADMRKLVEKHPNGYEEKVVAQESPLVHS